MILHFKFLHKKYIALTLWPFIFVKEKALKNNKVLINHERIHLRQQIELLWFPFFLWYIVEFLIKWAYYKDWDKAYRAISFERESYANETNMIYLKDRKIWSFWRYIRIDKIDDAV